MTIEQLQATLPQLVAAIPPELTNVPLGDSGLMMLLIHATYGTEADKAAFDMAMTEAEARQAVRTEEQCQRY